METAIINKERWHKISDRLKYAVWHDGSLTLVQKWGFREDTIALNAKEKHQLAEAILQAEAHEREKEGC